MARHDVKETTVMDSILQTAKYFHWFFHNPNPMQGSWKNGNSTDHMKKAMQSTEYPASIPSPQKHPS